MTRKSRIAALVLTVAAQTIAFATTALAAPTVGTPASPSYRTALLASARSKLLSTAPTGNGTCPHLNAIVYFIKTHGASTQVDAARFTSELDAAMSSMELVFVKDSVRASWNGKAGMPTIKQGARALGADVSTRHAIESACKCKLGVDSSKPVVVLFNNTGDESGFETSLPKPNIVAVHELLHVVLPRFGGKLAGSSAAAWHHGLTEYLGWEGPAPNDKKFTPHKACMN